MSLDLIAIPNRLRIPPDRLLKPRLAGIILLALMACALRLYHLDQSPLNGDEAFTVRYWAAPPVQVLQKLAWVEPHPFGTFFSFWAWKSLVGDGEFAMRMLPLLVNLLGVPAMYALSRRLIKVFPPNLQSLSLVKTGKGSQVGSPFCFTGEGLREGVRKVIHSDSIAFTAALLWAINPDQIWHAQDVRSYAIWSALSLIAFWLLLCAVDRSRRIDWLLYIIAATLSLYIFFLEIFFLAVHGLTILLLRQRALRSWLLAVVIIGVLLIPWTGQAWALAHSGYRGTGTVASLSTLASDFLPELALGQPFTTPLALGLRLALLCWFAACIVIVLVDAKCRAQAGPLLILLLLPTALLVVAAIRLDVFLPRYLIGITPAVLMIPAIAARRSRLALLLLAPLLIGSIVALAYYFYSDYRKAPDWYSLRAYLRTHTTAQDTVIMSSTDPQTGVADPAFEYYYRGPANVITLPNPTLDPQKVVQTALATRRAVWFIVVGDATVNKLLLADGTLISDEGAGLQVRQYRDRVPKASEIETPLTLTVGNGSVRGYSVMAGKQTTLLLFWDHLPDPDLTAFIHVIGPAKTDGSTLWAQDDHPPSASRDVYHLDVAAAPPGRYMLIFGVYRHEGSSNVSSIQPIPITDAAGKTWSESYQLATFNLP